MELGLLPKDFWSLTLNEYLTYAEGRSKAQEFDLLNTRTIIWHMYANNPYAKRKPKLTDIMELSFDKHRENLKPNVSKEEFIRKSKKIKARWQQTQR